MRGSCSGELTVVVYKGMNSDDNIAAIDAMPGVHFITTYSTYYADDLARVKSSHFGPVDTAKNRKLEKLGREEDRLVAYRTTRQLWGKERTVVVTYNPLTAAKQRYGFEKKLMSIQVPLRTPRQSTRRSKVEGQGREALLRLLRATLPAKGPLSNSG